MPNFNSTKKKKNKNYKNKNMNFIIYNCPPNKKKTKLKYISISTYYFIIQPKHKLMK